MLRLTKAVPEAGAALISYLPNVRYLTGFTGSAGRLLVTADRAVLVTDGRYRFQAVEQAPDVELVVTPDPPVEALAGLVREMARGRLAVEAHALTWEESEEMRRTWTGVELVPSGRLVEEIRQVKEESELAAVRRAAALAEGAFLYVLSRMKPGMREREVATILDAAMLQAGADSASFPTIVASGKNAALAHHQPGNAELKIGEFIVIDFGCVADGYCSDETRTVVIGRVSGRHREVYDAVKASQAAGLAAVKHGASCGDVDRAARSVMEAAGLGAAFEHSTGHGVGMEIHEAPRLKAGSDDKLTSRMVVTVEPGAYIKDFGGVRIEDLVVVGAKGPEVLTVAPKELIIL
ncbi:MAG: aminopeptidase P family protein [Actinomycetota bacterium]